MLRWRAMVPSSENYSNIKHEELGLVWELETLHYFIYGKQGTIQTHHKPLEAIFRKELSSCPAKLQRFVLGALKYDVKVTNLKGTAVPIADALSIVSPQPAAAKSQLPQLDIHYVTNTLSESQARLQHIWEETTSDPALNGLREKNFRGWADKREKYPESLYDYWSFREKLTIKDGLMLKADWIVVPSSLCREMLSIIHQGYLGREKCLLRARTSIVWPGLTKNVIDLVKECEPCQRHQRQQQKQPIVQPEPPSFPWQRLNSDLFEFKGHEYLLLSDQYSKFPVITKLTSMSSQAIVTRS